MTLLLESWLKNDSNKMKKYNFIEMKCNNMVVYKLFEKTAKLVYKLCKDS